MTRALASAILSRMTDRELKAFADLVGVCRRLRAPDGCPWDREQTLTTMTPYLTEEAVESGEAIASGDRNHVAEELGDLAFLSIFCLELLAGEGGPDLAESLERASQKLIRRHPHVYGDTTVKDGDAAYRQWQEIKKAEKGDRAEHASLLGDQPKGLPALVAAYRTQEKAAAVGFDWPDAQGPLAKVREETEELAREVGHDVTLATRHEVGDLLFAVVNLARHLRIDPERELRATTHRFRDRFPTSSAGSPSRAARPRRPRSRRWTSCGRRPSAALARRTPRGETHDRLVAVASRPRCSCSSCSGLQQACMMSLGKLMNPDDAPARANLEAARDTIDTLSAIESSTRGNLEPDEQRVLTQVLTDLRLNYVDEVKKSGGA